MKIKQIQGIRALAILGIFLCHTNVFIGSDIGIWKNLFDELGGTGVFTFFFISGYLFTYKGVPIVRASGFESIKLAWKKIKKLYPLHVICLIVAFIAKFDDYVTFDSFRQCAVAIISPIFNLTLTQSFVPFTGIINDFNGPSWFLSALFGVWIINFSIPKIMNSVLNFRLKKVFAGLGLVAIFQIIVVVLIPLLPLNNIPVKREWYIPWITYFNPVLCYSEFLFGALSGRLIQYFKDKYSHQNLLSVVTLILAISVLFEYNVIENYIPLVLIVECILIFGFLNVITGNTAGERLLSSTIIVYIGNISGYVFLIHGPVNFSIRTFIQPYIGTPYLFFISLTLTILLSVGYDQYLKNVKCKQ